MDVTNFNRDRKQKKRSIDFNAVVYGKVPPQAHELEEAIIGIVMLEKSAYDEIANVVVPEMFYVDAHQRIWRAIQRLSNKNWGIDILTVVEELRFSEELDLVGGSFYVTKLTNSVVSSANIKVHVHIIMQKYVQRELIRLSGELIGDAYEDNADPFELIAKADQKVFEVSSFLAQAQHVPLNQLAVRVAQKVLYPEQLTEDQRAARYLYTGFRDWDRINGPLFPGIYIIAARPGAGKTAFVLQLLVNMSRKFPVGFINIEMTDEQNIFRMVCNLAGLNNEEFKIEYEKWDDATKKLFVEGIQQIAQLNLFVESGESQVDRICNLIRYWKRKHGVKAVAIDYLQIMTIAEELLKYMTETAAINHIMKLLRQCAKSEGVTIFLLSQLNREMYRRAGSKEPNLADLKGSGNIEQDAFQIVFLHRPEYFEPDLLQDPETGESIKGLCVQIIAKHRDGRLGRIKHKFEPHLNRFVEWESDFVAYTTDKETGYKQISIPGTDPIQLEGDLPF